MVDGKFKIFNAMSSRRLKNKQTSKQTIKISESSMKTVHSLVGHVRRNFETCLIPLRFGTIREQEWLLINVFISSRLILMYFIGFLSIQVNQSDYSSENASRNLELTRVCNLLFIIFAWKMCLKTRVNPTFLMNIRIPRSLLLNISVFKQKCVWS